MANLVFPRPQFIDTNGVPLASGTITTYAAGTTTPKATYPTKTDLQALTNANNTTLTLNSYGIPAVDLWLNGSYKFLIKDSLGNTVYTTDNVNDPEILRDAAGNKLLTLTGVGSPVNYVELTNAATGSPALIGTTGSDTNVGLTISTKGSGVITLDGDVTVTGSLTPGSLAISGDTLTINGSSSSAGRIRLAEDTDNGTNYLEIKAPASITSNSVLTLPDGFETSGYLLNTSGTLSIDPLSLLRVRQIVVTPLVTSSTTTTILPYDGTIPQNTEGGEITGLQTTITPASASSTLYIFATVMLTASTADAVMTTALFVDTTANALAAVSQTQKTSGYAATSLLMHSVASGSTSARTYKIRVGSSIAGTTTWNVQTFGGVVTTRMVVIEVGG